MRDIPDDLLEEASGRLGLISLLGVARWLTGAVLDHVAMRAMYPGDPRWRQLHPPDAVVGIGILTSLGLFAYSRASRRSPRFLLDLGLVYLVLTSLDIGIIWHWRGSPDGSLQPMFTWVGSLVLMFAAIIPNPPWKTLVAGLIAASMMPVGMLIARARGVWDFGSPADALLMHYPDYIMVGVSVVISRVVTRLGQHVTRARELGSNHVGELLGRGGMGEVYRATHRMLARPAAIKLIRPEVIEAGDGEAAQLALRRFRREAEVAASLWSPHTVELYDFAVTEDLTTRRHGPRSPGARARSPAGEPGRSYPAPGLRIAGGSARARAGPPGHQAGQPPPGSARTAPRFRQGARLRAGEGRGRRRPALPCHRRRCHPRDPGLHGPGDRAGRKRDGRADL